MRAAAGKRTETKTTAVKATARFRVGQVVRIDTEMYRLESSYGNERYQRITKVWDWYDANPGVPKFGYTFLNGYECNEVFVRELTKKERGGL